MAIDVSLELTTALHDTAQVFIRPREALKSPDPERYRRVLKEWFATEQRRREAWLATPVPTTTGV